MSSSSTTTCMPVATSTLVRRSSAIAILMHHPDHATIETTSSSISTKQAIAPFSSEKSFRALPPSSPNLSWRSKVAPPRLSSSRRAGTWLAKVLLLLLVLNLVVQRFNATIGALFRGREEAEVVWSSRGAGVRQYWLPKPFEKHRFTVLQAVVRRRTETYEQEVVAGVVGVNGSTVDEFVQVSGFMEGTLLLSPTYDLSLDC